MSDQTENAVMSEEDILNLAIDNKSFVEKPKPPYIAQVKAQVVKPSAQLIASAAAQGRRVDPNSFQVQLTITPKSYRTSAPFVRSFTITNNRNSGFFNFRDSVAKLFKLDIATVAALLQLINVTEDGGFFEIQELAWQKSRDGKATTYIHFHRQVEETEAQAIIPSNVGVAAGPQDAPAEAEVVDPHAVVLELLGDGATLADLKATFWKSPYKSNRTLSNGIMTGNLIRQMVKDGTLTEEDGTLRCAA